MILNVQNGSWIERATGADQLLAFMQIVRPVANGKGLLRFGPSADGGYLIPDDLDQLLASVSAGVSSRCGFDSATASSSVDVYLGGRVGGWTAGHARFKFAKKNLSNHEDETNITLDKLCRSIPGFKQGGDLMVQMDIEGAEYEILHRATDNLLRRFRIIVVEFHYLDELFSSFSFKFIKSVFDRLLTFYHVVHTQPNNWGGSIKSHKLEFQRIMEFSFYRKDRHTFSHSELSFPHHLDTDTVQRKAPLVLPSHWRCLTKPIYNQKRG